MRWDRIRLARGLHTAATKALLRSMGPHDSYCSHCAGCGNQEVFFERSSRVTARAPAATEWVRCGRPVCRCNLSRETDRERTKPHRSKRPTTTRREETP